MVNFLAVRITDRRSSQVTDENAIREKRSDGHVDETKACESGKSIHQTNESVMPYPPYAPSFRRHSSPGLLHGRFGPFYRFNGSSGTQAREGTLQDERQTDKRRRRDKGPGAKGTAAEKRRRYFTKGERTRRITGRRRGRGRGMSRVERTEGTTRGGVVGCGQIC